MGELLHNHKLLLQDIFICGFFEFRFIYIYIYNIDGIIERVRVHVLSNLINLKWAFD
jgi:hypothetical protein